MTAVLVTITSDSADGTPTPVAGSLVWTPTARRIAGTDVVLPAPVVVDLDGTDATPVTVHLAPSGVTWAWRVDERVPGGQIRTVSVPDSTSPVPYADLLELDPTTLTPAATPESAWWLALENLEPGGGSTATPVTITAATGTLAAGSVVTVLSVSSTGAGRVRLYRSAADRTAGTGAVYDWSPTGMQYDPDGPLTLTTTDGSLYWQLDGGTSVTLTYLTVA